MRVHVHVRTLRVKILETVATADVSWQCIVVGYILLRTRSIIEKITLIIALTTIALLNLLLRFPLFVAINKLKGSLLVIICSLREHPR
jgi:hypothetical protein